MQYIIPHYYKKFACIGGDCPDTCCAGWQIMIDPFTEKIQTDKRAAWQPLTQ